MSFNVGSEAEAYAAVALLAVGADGVGTMEEGRFLFDELGQMGVFADHDHESFGQMLGALTGRMFAGSQGTGGMTAETVGEICAGVRSVLDAQGRSDAFNAAVRVACCDGLENVERAVLGQIAEALGLDGDAVAAAIGRASDRP